LKVIFFANTDWYLYNFRLGFAKYLRDRDFEVVMVSPPGGFGQLLEAEGFRWIPVDMQRRSINPLRELGVLGRIAGIYAAEQPDVVHHFTIKCVVYGSIAAIRHGIRNRVNAIAGMGYVFSSQDLGARLLRPLVRSLMRIVTGGRRARLIVQNRDDLSAFQAAGVTPSKNMRLIRSSGVNTHLFKPVGARNHGVTRVLLAARLLWDKGIAEYIAAARALKDAGVAVEMLLAGNPDSGNPASVHADDVARWHAEGLVTHLGHVINMPDLLSKVDIAVLPSHREGVPRSLTEAAAAGLPIIATDVPGCREVVEHGSNGLLVPVRQVQPLVEAIQYLHERPDERFRLGAAGRQKAVSEFDESIVFSQTLAVYAELLTSVAAMLHGGMHVADRVGTLNVYRDSRTKAASSSRV
jgi:glycosyltransferase involved in cell wall biosynthesis